MRKISVIIPIFNDENYLKECIESVINQTLGFENIQVILVDDCSEDKSYEIALEYERKYPQNIICKKLDKNSSSGGKPRNVGIDMAEAKYLMFADADDFFAKDAFENMYCSIEEKQADFVISNFIFADIEGNPWTKPNFDPERFNEFKLSIKDYEQSFYIINSSMCNKIFNREFINEYHIRCLEGVNGEDTYFSMLAFLNSKNAYYIPKITYFYRQRNTSQKVVSTTWNCSKEYFEGMNVSYRKLYEAFVEYNQVDFYRLLYARNRSWLLYRFIDSKQLTKEDKLELLPELKWFFELSKTLKVPACQKLLTSLIDKIVEEKYEDVIEICDIIGEVRSYLTPEIRNEISKPLETMYREILKNKI